MNSTENKQVPEPLRKALEYIDSHIIYPISLEELSAQAGVSPFHFHRIFSQYIGQTPLKHINRIRLELAANILIYNPLDSITDISYDLHFSSPTAFTRAFKQHFSLSPRELREKQNSKNRKVFEKNLDYTDAQTQEIASTTPIATTNWSITLEYVQPKTIAYIRFVGTNTSHHEHQAKITEVWDSLLQWAHTSIPIDAETKLIGINMDNPLFTPKGMQRFYAGITTMHPFRDKTVNSFQLPGGQYIVVDCFINQEQFKTFSLGDLFTYLFTELFPEKGYVVNGYHYIEYDSVALPQFDKDTYSFKIYIPIKNNGIYNTTRNSGTTLDSIFTGLSYYFNYLLFRLA